MDKRNIRYYGAAAGIVLVFIIALVALTTCGEQTRDLTTQEQAVRSAYQQGYLDGYSKGYSDGFSAGRTSNTAGQPEVSLVTDRVCIPTGVASETDDLGTEPPA